MKKTLVATIFICVIVALGFPAGTEPVRAQGEAVISIGMAKTFFADVPLAFVDAVKDPFGDLMKAATGLRGELHTESEPFALADQLDKGTRQLGVFHGHELAWVRQKHPNIKPLIVVVNKYREVCSYVIVHKECSALHLADLRGKKFDLPLGSKAQCRVYVEKHCVDNNQPDWTKFFGTAMRSSSILSALNDVAKKQTDAVVIDRLSLELYKKERGPVFDTNLRILAQSKQFPPVVIAYSEGKIASATLKKINDGLRKAGDFEQGREIMSMWQVDAFESVPAGFEQMLTEISKNYPAR